MNELHSLLEQTQLELPLRSEFNEQVNELVETLAVLFPPLYISVLADRLAVLATELKNSVASDVEAVVSAWEINTNDLYGDYITRKTTVEYEYPSDSQLESYMKTKEAKLIELQPLQVELSAIDEAVKQRQKQLVQNGIATVKNTKYSISIKKK